MKHLLSFGSKPTGRPPVVSLSAAELDEISACYVAGTNHSKTEGSMVLAWVRFCEAHPERFGHLVRDHLPATTIPSAVVEACRRRRALIGAYRGGAPRQRHEGAYVPGTMRRSSVSNKRLMAGERASVDDATRNVACWIPWPWGGCECSEKFGVRLGRWQTLIVHDDASSFVPFVSSVFRWHQSYKATDAASVILRAETSVCEWDAWSIEGGVWQAKRTLAVLAGRFISAKGRPNQKLVENYIGRLWGIMSDQAGDVGRHRGEMKKNSDVYVKCRAGKEDPRKHFMSLNQAQECLYSAVEYLNEKRIRSRTYGEWVPKSRWEADLTESPRTTRNRSDDFLIQPAAETRKVSNGMFRVTLDGPLGVPMVWTFAADWLHEFNRRDVTAYFDPMAPWPVTATITLAGQRKPLGTVECINSIGESKDRATEIVKSIRQTMMSETRVIATRFTERQIRHNRGVIVTASAQQAADVSIDPSDRIAASSRDPRDASLEAPRITREDVSNSLARRARIAREGRHDLASL